MTTLHLSFVQIKPSADQRLDPVSVSPGQSHQCIPRVSGNQSPGFQLDVTAGVGTTLVCYSLVLLPLGDGVPYVEATASR